MSEKLEATEYKQAAEYKLRGCEKKMVEQAQQVMKLLRSITRELYSHNRKGEYCARFSPDERGNTFTGSILISSCRMSMQQHKKNDIKYPVEDCTLSFSIGSHDSEKYLRIETSPIDKKLFVSVLSHGKAVYTDVTDTDVWE